MRALLAALLGLLIAFAADAAPVAPPAISQLQATPAANGDILSLQSQAPRRNKLALSFAGGSQVSYTVPAGTASETYFVVAPLEATPYALRFFFAEPWEKPMQIISAWAYPTDSYAGLWFNGSIVTQQLYTEVLPTNNSVYINCTLVTGVGATACDSTGSIPTSTGTVYAVAPQGTFAVTGVQPVATVTDPTHISVTPSPAQNYTGPVQFANKAVGSQLCFDDGGAVTDTIHTTCTKPGITVAGNPTQATHGTLYPYTPQASDFVPFAPLARQDGQSTNLVLIMVTLGPSGTTAFGGVSNNTASPFNAQVAPLFGNRMVFSGSARTTNVDYAATPEANFHRTFAGAPVLGIQYLTDARGHQVLTTGTSLSTSPPDDVYSTPIKRGCWAVSTPLAPCELWNTAWGGNGTPLWLEIMRSSIGIIDPSAIVIEAAGGGNDYPGVEAVYQTALNEAMAKHFSYTSKLAAKIGIWGRAPCNNCNDITNNFLVFQAQQLRLAKIIKGCQPNTGGAVCPAIPLLDGTATSRGPLGGNPWDFGSVGLQNVKVTAAGATSIGLNSTYVGVVCKAGDTLIDATTPAALSAATVSADYVPVATTLAVTAGSIVGGGVIAGDLLVCSQAGFAGAAASTYDGGAMSLDGTHPWYPAMAKYDSTGFMRQLLGYQ